MERAMAETSRRREKQAIFNSENNITPESIKKNIGDILGSVYERDHARADISGFAEQGAMMGANLKTHIEHLEKQMRLAATDLDFETAARLRDEIKRLRETELAIADDPMAREMEVGPSRRRSAAPQDEGGRSLFRKNTLDEMTVGRTEVPLGSEVRPVRRERAGAGSYEDAGDAKRAKRRPGKTGRPGR
jgi:excinuclease ABC subunit B